jgi:hypothetical protein
VKKVNTGSSNKSIDKDFDKKLADALDVINQAKEKFYLLMKHKQRVVSQQNKLQGIETLMQN